MLFGVDTGDGAGVRESLLYLPIEPLNASQESLNNRNYFDATRATLPSLEKGLTVRRTTVHFKQLWAGVLLRSSFEITTIHSFTSARPPLSHSSLCGVGFLRINCLCSGFHLGFIKSGT